GKYQAGIGMSRTSCRHDTNWKLGFLFYEIPARRQAKGPYFFCLLARMLLRRNCQMRAGIARMYSLSPADICPICFHDSIQGILERMASKKKHVSQKMGKE